MEARKVPSKHEPVGGDRIRKKNVTVHNGDNSESEDSDSET